MWFWWLMLACNIIVPFITIFTGWFMWKRPPKEINRIIGYRTKRSMYNNDTWKFAHNFCGKLWWIMGWIILGISVAVLIPFIHSTDLTIGIAVLVSVAVQCLILVLSMIPTEIALKKTFFDNGTRE
ncbi:MAG: SdpI family protein [Clostridia bacterium]|nr:SdpI family protein [Clostridia bacterium]